jgi:protein-S-isoprenylcysteine O-methyltransferase Ste14
VFSRPAVLLEIIWVIWLCSWVGAAFWSGQTQKIIGDRETWTYRAAMIAGGVLLVQWIPAVFGEKPLWNVGTPGGLLLALIMVAGLSFTWWGRIYLGRMWSSVISKKEGHHIIDTGPYSLVRHPIYTGLIVGLLATGIAEGTVSGIIGAALIIYGIYLKASSEERFLRAELGPPYETYSRRVPMLVPFLPHG